MWNLDAEGPAVGESPSQGDSADLRPPIPSHRHPRRRLATTAGALAATGALLAACSSPPGSQFVGTWTCPGTADQTGSFQITAADNGTYALVRGNDTTALPATYNETIDELTVTTNNGTWIARIDPTSGELTTIDDPNWGIDAAIDRLATTDTTTYSTATVKYLDQSKLLAAVSANDPELAYSNVELEGTRVTQAEQDNEEAKSEGAVVFQTTSKNTIAGTDEVFAASPGGEAVFAFDPTNSELTDCCGARIGDNTDVNFSGVMPLKFRFDTPQADIQVFNTDLQAPVTTKFEEVVNEYGMELYRFTQSIPPTQLPGDPLLSVPMDVAKVAVGVFAPAIAPQLESMPADQPVELYRFTSAENEFLVEPKTGQIVDGRLNSKDTARFDNGTEDILTVAEVQGQSADVETGAEEIRASADLIKGLDLPPCDQSYSKE